MYDLITDRVLQEDFEMFYELSIEMGLNLGKIYE